MGKLCRVGPGKLFERQPATDLGEGFLMESVRFLHKLMKWEANDLKVPEVGGLRRIPGTC